MPQLIESLSRYATHQEENFLTEALVYIVGLLLEREREHAISILKIIAGNPASGWATPEDEIKIGTQLSTELGRPDIVIRINYDKIILVEVKHDSGLGQAQLERYHHYLETRTEPLRHLVLLTRSRSSIRQTTLDTNLFSQVCWYEISGLLSELPFEDPVAAFLVGDFLSFLRSKEMSMEKVSWQYIEGVPASGNLAAMLGTAIAEVAAQEKTRRSAGWHWWGYYLREDPSIFIGVRYHEPLKVVFENNGGTDPTFQRALSLEEAHFFSLSAGEQLECLIRFVSTALAEYSNP